ncbi:MAG: aminotransferase class V-fold PLP-dependent enzyme, partial [Actinobacteria bacterium]|nr:aminotransferase class V-fold PLP-dependent enzyme [Actinomycetota bacterium]
MKRPTIYMDNAATSWPKPPAMLAAMRRSMEEVGANPGRSGHRPAVAAARVVHGAREAVAELLGVSDPLRVVFTANATQALNLALRGLLVPGDHVVTTGMEHNSVMRPLRALEQEEGLTLTVVPCSPDGRLDPNAVEEALRRQTKLIVVNHASNVIGTVLPVREVAGIARRHGVLLLVDGAQSAGALPFSVGEMGIDLFAFTGHKSLYGPTGTGGLLIGERVDVERFRPLVWGGTGSRSGSETQPGFLPDKFEGGTLNVVGLAGLEAGVRWVIERGVEEIRARERAMTADLIAGLRGIGDGGTEVRVHGVADADRRLPTVSFTVAGMEPAEVGLRLDDEYGIAARVGLHCAPPAHRTMGTYPAGTVRLSLGAFTTQDDVAAAVAAVRALAR